MVTEIISVGTELLLGNIVNTNAQYLAGRLAELGFDLYYQTVVGDNTEHLKGALDVAYTRAELVILTGGLGPTKDDMTKLSAVSFYALEQLIAITFMTAQPSSYICYDHASVS